MFGCLLLWAAPAGCPRRRGLQFTGPGSACRPPPAFVTIVCDQPVKPDNGGVIVLNSSGQNVGEGGTTHPAPDTLRAALPRSLPSGAYVANYTVTSVDGHVVSGGIVFLVGNARPGSIASLTRPPTSAATWYDRGGQFLTYLGVLAAGGLAFFLAFLLPEGTSGADSDVGAGSSRDRCRRHGGDRGGPSRPGRRERRGPVPLDCPVSRPPAESSGPSARCSSWDWPAAWCRFVCGRAPARQATAFYGLLLSAGAFVAFGHALVSPERWLSTPADVVHVVFAAMWFGGLIGLVSVLHSRVRGARVSSERWPPFPVPPATTLPDTDGGGKCVGGTATACSSGRHLRRRTSAA